jgi:hypothetical protein
MRTTKTLPGTGGRKTLTFKWEQHRPLPTARTTNTLTVASNENNKDPSTDRETNKGPYLQRDEQRPLPSNENYKDPYLQWEKKKTLTFKSQQQWPPTNIENSKDTYKGTKSLPYLQIRITKTLTDRENNKDPYLQWKQQRTLPAMRTTKTPPTLSRLSSLALSCLMFI